MICAGAIMMAIPIFFIAMDEGAGWSLKNLNTSCVLREWFHELGFLIVYMALFSKVRLCCYIRSK